MKGQIEYPEKLQDLKLECLYIGMLLNNPKAISMYYFLYDDCLFSEDIFDAPMYQFSGNLSADKGNYSVYKGSWEGCKAHCRRRVFRKNQNKRKG